MFEDNGFGRFHEKNGKMNDRRKQGSNDSGNFSNNFHSNIGCTLNGYNGSATAGEKDYNMVFAAYHNSGERRDVAR